MSVRDGPGARIGRRELGPQAYADLQLLGELAVQGGHGILAGLDLATGELPAAGQRPGLDPPGGQHARGRG